eukprot:CAMPEP_0182890962 /NCGR_PEP_ID=MMETSP0034_2-20130328/22973_1 /TAXON_ID=156128 /ORGANISM="Nephroselmis pyriformis, Strain CCMP717" /LENGTH=167 /DNA_ID=CAMNT_0025024547 /DNA_START=10 /DNA_END=513 /DNA_ORIENTATION=+
MSKAIKAIGGLTLGAVAVYEAQAYYHVHSAGSLEDAMVRMQNTHFNAKKSAERSISTIMARVASAQEAIAAKQAELSSAESELLEAQERVIALTKIRQDFNQEISTLEDTLSKAQDETVKYEEKIAQSEEGMAVCVKRAAAAREKKDAAARMLNPMNLPLFKNLLGK